MSRIAPWSVLAVIVILCGCSLGAPRFESTSGERWRIPFDLSTLDKDIAFNKARVARDPKGALGWSLLAGAHLKRARLFDSTSDAVAAEQAARRSLKIREAGNIGAANKLVQALLDQHRFREAKATLDWAIGRRLVDDASYQLQAQVALELGDFEAAVRTVADHPSAMRDPGGMVLNSRIAFLSGHSAEALELVNSAERKLEDNALVGSDVLAWIRSKRGDILFAVGKVEEARKAYDSALELLPGDYKSLFGRARIASGTGDWQSAISWGEKALDSVPMPECMALVSDAYRNIGQSVKAAELLSQAAESAGKSGVADSGLRVGAKPTTVHGHTLDRQYAQLCADHEIDLEGAYASALRDSVARQDVYTFDTLAWVTFKLGLLDEAKAASDKALRLGTQDARMLFHAAEIYDRLGEKGRAGDLYAKAIVANPYFDHPSVAKARKKLTEYGG